MIKNSLEWEDRRAEYKSQIRALPYNREIRTMLQNIDNMVNALSKAEVIARRKHVKTETLPELEQVNSAIKNLEQWLMMGTLLR
jgi:hypothetical protein